jgi:hypothetical protein
VKTSGCVAQMVPKFFVVACMICLKTYFSRPDTYRLNKDWQWPEVCQEVSTDRNGKLKPEYVVDIAHLLMSSYAAA